MGELYDPFPKLPKNIRQIGERDEIVKLYVEDYVNTYLKRLYPAAGQQLRVGLLLGSTEMTDGTPYIFVDGAMEMENITEGDKVLFSEAAWKRAYQCMDQMFPRRSVLGWFLVAGRDFDLSPLNYWKHHMQYFQGPNKLMYLNSGTEDSETLYITSEDGFYKLRGYSIYYERNQMMQDYMVLRKDTKREEADTDDKVIRDFKKRLESRKEEAEDKHQTVSLLGGLCTAMSIVILAGGIVMFNNYGKMQDMESVIASALPEKASAVLIGKDNTGKKESRVILEEAEGGVYPTAAPVGKETMASTEPGNIAGSGSKDGDGAAGAASDQAAAGQADGAGNQAGADGTKAGTASGNGEKAEAASNDEAKAGAASGDGAKASQASDQVKAEQSKTAGKEAKQVDASAYRTYIVQDGETLYGICLAQYQTMNKLQEICELNGLEDENKIVSGQKLLLP